MKNLNKYSIDELKKDSVFKKRMSDEINQIINLEMAKPDDEIDWEIIDECTDSLLFLNNMENDDLKITPFLIKKYRTKYIISNIFKATSGMAAAIALGIIAWGIISNQSQPLISNEVDSTTTTTSVFIQAEESTTAPVELTTEKVKNDTSEIVSETSTKNNSSTTHKATENRTTKINNEVAIKPTKKTHENVTNVSTTHREKPTQITTTSNQEVITQPTTVVVESEKILASISGEFGKGFKTVYFVGDELDLFGLSVIAHYEDGTTSVINNARCSFNGFSSNTIGNKTIIVNYEGKSFTFNVKVVNRG